MHFLSLSVLVILLYLGPANLVCISIVYCVLRFTLPWSGKLSLHQPYAGRQHYAGQVSLSVSVA